MQKGREYIMKKIIILLLTVVLSFTMFGCKKQEENTEKPVEENIIDTEEPEVEPPKEEVVPPVKEEPLPDKEEPEEYTGLLEKDAKSLVTERLDSSIYKVEADEGLKEIEGQKYYIFTISTSEGDLAQKIAVENQSGELYCYNGDSSISPYSEFELFDETKDAECDWNGTFLRVDKTGKNNGTLDLAQGDINSFEFSISTGAKKKGIEFGLGQITGNTAIFEDDKGFKIEFVMKDNVVTIKESGKNSYLSDNGKFDGVYTLEEN